MTSPSSTKRPRGRNATSLAEFNPFDFDDRVTFDERDHTYTVDGKQLHMSVSDVVKLGFANNTFNPAVVIKKNLASWRSQQDSKYFKVVDGLADEDAYLAVRKVWDGDADKGTRLHKWAELTANDVTPADSLDEMAQEQTQILTGWAMLSAKGLQITRTEHSLFYPSKDPWLGGQVDFLMRGDAGFTIVDLKRSEKNLSAEAPAYGRKGVGPMSVYSDNAHMRYSLQQSLYAVLLEELTGDRVTDLYLLQVHPSQTHPKLIPCTDLRVEARAILSSLPPCLPPSVAQLA